LTTLFTITLANSQEKTVTSGIQLFTFNTSEYNMYRY